MMVVQMHGEPGSGKSTLAQALGQHLPAVVVDQDTNKSRMIEHGIGDQTAGAIGHEIMRGLAADFLGAGASVVLDSPCGCPAIETDGRQLAARFDAPRVMVELTRPAAVIDKRLATRTAHLINPARRQSKDTWAGTYEPEYEQLTADGPRPMDEMVFEALTYLRASDSHSHAAAGGGVALAGLYSGRRS